MQLGSKRSRWTCDTGGPDSLTTWRRCDPLVDLGAEAQSLLAEDALSTFFVEPYKSESAPRPIGGIEKDLTLSEWVRILLVNVE